MQDTFKVADSCSFNLTINITGTTDLKLQIVSSVTGDNSSVSIAQFSNIKTSDITIGSSYILLNSSVSITPTFSTGTSQVLIVNNIIIFYS